MTTNPARRLRNAVALTPAGVAFHRSKMVTDRWRYFVGDALKRPGIQTYELPAGHKIHVRHDNREDSFVLEEVFGSIDSYGVPAELRLGKVERITDLGGNIGMASLKFALDFPDATITAVEADPTNATVLESVVALNDLKGRVSVIRAAASTSDGTLRFVSGRGGRSHAADTTETGIDVPAVDIIPQLQQTDLLKMDIEGGEWPILSDPRFKDTSVRAIVMEYHDFLCPNPDPTATVRDLLTSAGFELPVLREEGAGGVLWAVR